MLKRSYKQLRKKSKVGKKLSGKNNKKSVRRMSSKRMSSKRMSSKRMSSKRMSRRVSRSKRVTSSRRVTSSKRFTSSKRGSRKFKMDTRRYKQPVTIDNRPRKQSGLDFVPEGFYERAQKLDEIHQLEEERKKLWAWNFNEDQRLVQQITKAKMELQLIRDPIRFESLLRSQEMHHHRKDKILDENHEEDDEENRKDEADRVIEEIEDDMDEYDFCDSSDSDCDSDSEKDER